MEVEEEGASLRWWDSGGAGGRLGEEAEAGRGSWETGLQFQELGEAVHWRLEFLDMDLGAHRTDLVDMHLHMDPWGSSSYRGMCIQDSAAEFAGTMDSTAAAVVAAAWLQSQILLAEIVQPLLWSGWPVPP